MTCSFCNGPLSTGSIRSIFETENPRVYIESFSKKNIFQAGAPQKKNATGKSHSQLASHISINFTLNTSLPVALKKMVL